MKNIIRVLLYVLLALLVVAIAMVIYKKSNNQAEVVEGTADQVDSLFLDVSTQSGPLSPEDSMIMDLTGELPSQTGVNENVNSTIDYSQPVHDSQINTAAENTSPKVQNIANTTSNTTKKEPSPIKKTETVPKETKAIPKKTDAANTSAKDSDKAAKATPSAVKANGLKTFYVIAGSFIVPSHADKQVEKLKKLGFGSSMKKVFGDSEYYSAVAGKFNNRDEADKTTKSLKAKGITSFVKQN